MSLRYILSVSVAAALLSGCATPKPPYAPPEGAPTANLKSAISGANSRNESIGIGVVEKEKREPSPLFSIYKSESQPAGYVKVPANEPLILHYYETASGGRICKLTIQVTLETGKNYSLVGGGTYQSGPIPVLMGTRGCEFGVVDDASNKPVPAQRAQTNLPWFAQ
jgi:hypothetical protein